jgi:DNA-binding PadR family transcriptional regulator
MQKKTPSAARLSCSDDNKRLVLRLVAATGELRAASIKTSAEDNGIGYSTMRNCLRALAGKGLLQALQDPDKKGSKRYKITADGKKWLKDK